MPITWDDSMSTGIPAVDAEHQELFRQVERFHTVMSEGKGAEELAKLLDFLGQYTARHFSREECFMEQFKCPAAAANKAAHKQLLEKFGELRESFIQQGGGPSIAVEIYRTLCDWLVRHVRDIDTKLRDSVQSAKQPAGKV